ncbi:MAG: CoA transferase [Dehalococcoidia bacterium]|jgi:crotonobetainyl-CoA:carnitine CoA-transferase CaiB-like acyl-CoA transferase|nr:CoA transferase [Dehalococcoidia bacterium]MDP6229059.1 CoA transferase [Dehalococcoidia bacterium]MDP7085606.1 CoA transferase [Dehalococcoidia bacterium]MDP7202308.1 CoA transferase [Dehalococcoidia bacterium]MDP7509805.1 CoA transferase [Dehalococcoidia bacterium]
MAAVLEGITALDLTQGVAGPYCTKLLAGMGAEVIKVETPATGDPSRGLGPFVNDDPHPEKSLLFLYLNTGKKGLTLDIQSGAGRDILRELARGVDILVEGFEPRLMPGLGLHYSRLSGDNPGLVMTSLTFFGQDGPYGEYKGEEIIAQAMSGNLQITGEPDREPVMIGGHFAQYVGGQAACVATLMAMYHAMITGQGQHVDCSIVEANADLLDSWGVNAVLGMKQQRTGTRHHGLYPAQAYPCRDGYAVLGTEPAGWHTLVDLVGDEVLRDPKYADPGRKKFQEEIDPVLVSWLRDRNKLDVHHAAQNRRVASGYLMTPEDMLESPQLREREYFQEIDHPATGPSRYPGPPFRFSGAGWDRSRAPLLGEHNQEVYGRRLSLSDGDLVRLKRRGVI